MNFSIVFNNTGDSIPFTVIENQPVFEFFVNKINTESQNLFFNNSQLATKIKNELDIIDKNIRTTNEIFPQLTNQFVNTKNALTDYLNQDILNKLHADWVDSQQITINIDDMRFNNNTIIRSLGEQLHHEYPDDIRTIRLSQALNKLGYIDVYEDINLSVHRIENIFNDIEFNTDKKYEIFDNPFKDSIITNNGISNFNFGYTYLGRQYYDKFKHFDNNLSYKDFYNYETLEFSFNLNLRKPESIPFSKEFLTWCEDNNVRPMGLQVPIGNIVNLENQIFDYRKIIYRNLSNKASIILN